MGAFGMMPGNNAPTPVFGGTNPTGMLPAGFGSKNSSGFPNYPMYGGMSNGVVTPSANMPVFGMTGGGGSSSNGMAGLSTRMDLGTKLDGNMLREFERAYGKGSGQLLYNIFNNGLFNPQVADSFLNAMQPSINQGQQSILNAFGAEGSRFGSAAALGLGNYLSQANLNEQQTLASMYMQAQQEQLSLLSGVLPTLHDEQANQGGLWQDILGGLEIAGGIAAAPFTGGMSLGLVGAGVGTLAGGLDGGGGGGKSGGYSAPFMPMGMPGYGGNTGTFGMGAPSWQASGGQFDEITQWNLDTTAGAALGGASSNEPLFGGMMP